MLTAVDAPVSRIELAFGGSRKLFSTSSGDPVERAVSILHEHLEPAKPCDVTCGGGRVTSANRAKMWCCGVAVRSDDVRLWQ